MPIFSFKVTDVHGEIIHQQLITRMLSDFYGVRAIGGCACAGPYADRLLDIDYAQSETIPAAVLSGQEIEKPGWTRLGFSVLMTDIKCPQAKRSRSGIDARYHYRRLARIVPPIKVKISESSRQ